MDKSSIEEAEMNIEERNRFLTETVLGKCYHDLRFTGGDLCRWICRKCKKESRYFENSPSFSTWQEFGLLWEDAIKRDDWLEFLHFLTTVVHPEDEYPPDMFYIHVHHIDPDRFATALFEFLKNRERK